MGRDTPRFLADLAILWIAVMVCVVLADAIATRAWRPWGLLAAVTVVVAVLVPLTCYHAYLDDPSALGRSSRWRFVVLAIQLLLVGSVLGALFGPPDPSRQVLTTLVTVLLAVPLSYWIVYRRDARSIAN